MKQNILYTMLLVMLITLTPGCKSDKIAATKQNANSFLRKNEILDSDVRKFEQLNTIVRKSGLSDMNEYLCSPIELVDMVYASGTKECYMAAEVDEALPFCEELAARRHCTATSFIIAKKFGVRFKVYREEYDSIVWVFAGPDTEDEHGDVSANASVVGSTIDTSEYLCSDKGAERLAQSFDSCTSAKYASTNTCIAQVNHLKSIICTSQQGLTSTKTITKSTTIEQN